MEPDHFTPGAYVYAVILFVVCCFLIWIVWTVLVSSVSSVWNRLRSLTRRKRVPASNP